MAATYNSPAVAKLLLANGAEVDGKHTYAWTPLHLAAMDGSPAVGKLLLANGAKVDNKDFWGRTPLHLAANYWSSWKPSNSPAVAKLLLVNGADPTVKDVNGRTPLDLWPALAKIVKQVEAEKAGKQQPAQPKVVTP